MALDLGCGRGHIAKQMNSDIVGTLYQCDVAEHMVVSDPLYFPPYILLVCKGITILATYICAHNKFCL